jgi:hypothetical protein
MPTLVQEGDQHAGQNEEKRRIEQGMVDFHVRHLKRALTGKQLIATI